MRDKVSYDKGLAKTLLDAFPTEHINLSKEKQQIASKIYNLLSEGNPVSIEEVAESLDMEKDNVRRITDEWAGMYYNHEGNIIGYWGLATEKTGHRFNLDKKTLYTWCAWDTLFIPQIIAKTARVESRDPVTKKIIKLTVTPNDGIMNVSPSEAVVSFMIPDTQCVKADVIKSFCNYVHFFESKESAEKWISESEKKEELLILPIAEAYEIGMLRNEQQLGDILETA